MDLVNVMLTLDETLLFSIHNLFHLAGFRKAHITPAPTVWTIYQRDSLGGGGFKVSRGAKFRNQYNQVPHLTQDTYGKVTTSQLDTTNESQWVSPFPAGDHKVHINRRAQIHSKHKTEQKHKRSTKEVPPWNGQ